MAGTPAGTAEAGERLLERLRPWACPGTARDQLITVTEGVIPHEERGPAIELGKAAMKVSAPGPHRLWSRSTRPRGSWSIGGLCDPLSAKIPRKRRSSDGGAVLRAGVSWDLEPGERLTGLGARHGLDFDQRGRCVTLGADRRYTGPDCPEDFLEDGGIPQGDYAPVPWLLSSAGWAAWLETSGPGAEFDLTGDAVSISARAAAGPLRLHLFFAATPAANLRALLRLTGMPALMPEWAYGHWKSRDVYEHQDDVEDDWRGYRETSCRLTRS